MDKKLPKVSSINCDITMQPMTDGLLANFSQGAKTPVTALRWGANIAEPIISAVYRQRLFKCQCSNKRNHHRR